MSVEGSAKDLESPPPSKNYSTFEETHEVARATSSDKKEPPITKQPKTNVSAKEKGSGYRPPEQEETEPWSFRLFGCLEEPKLCLATFCLPCYTEARNAEYFYEEQLETGIGYCLGPFGVGPVMRWRIRQNKKIKGHMLSDVAIHLSCPCCALVQENRELYGSLGSHAGEKIEMLKDQ